MPQALSSRPNRSNPRSHPIGWLIASAVLVGCVAAGVHLKMLPTHDYRYEAFEKDPALNYRLTEDALRNGRLPERDGLALYPQGRETAKYLPVLIYSISASWVRSVRAVLPSASLQDCLLWLNAVSIALIALPVFVIAWTLSRGRCAAALASIFVTVTPFFNHRGSADNMRAEMMGLTVGFLAVMSWVLSLDSADRRKALLHAVCAAVFFYVSVGIWRMNLLIFIVITVWYIFTLPGRKDPVRASAAYALFASGFAAAVMFQEYLSFHRAYLSAEAALAFAAILASLAVLAVRRRTGGEFTPIPAAAYRWGSVLLIAVLTAAFSLFSGDRVGSAAASTFKMAVKFWGFPVRLNEDDGLYEPVPELWPYDSPVVWFSGPVFSGLAVLFFAVKAWKWPESLVRSDAAGFVKTLFWTTAFLSFLVAVRNLMIFIPAASVALGIAVAAKIVPKPAARAGESVPGPWAALTVRRGAWVILTAVMIWMSVHAIVQRHKGPGPEGAFQSDFRRVLAYIKREVPEREPIASSWMMGYNLQTHSGRPTLTDSLVEHPEMRRRMREEFAAFAASDEAAVVDFLRKYGARWLLVDRSYPILAYQRVSKSGDRPDFIILKPGRLKQLRLELETKNLLLYRLSS